MTTNTLSLQELNQMIGERMRNLFPGSFWVMAEISECNVNYSGHCYLELVERDEADRLVAKSRAIIWSQTYRMLSSYFETSTGVSLKSGIKVLLMANIEFHSIYGFSLHITDIDPTYTIGEIARKKLEIIEKLKTEGVFSLNKELPMPSVIQKIAVISSENAAGYTDFKDQLINNQAEYRFYTRLFPAIMQGEYAEGSIINSLECIYPYADFFDCIVIVRGGGSATDLSCFDNYWLPYHICQFPLPVITGIGHEKDDSITDMVAHTRLKTPTACANFIIDKATTFDATLYDRSLKFTHTCIEIIESKKRSLTHLAKIHGREANLHIQKHVNRQNKRISRFTYLSKQLITHEHHNLEISKLNINNALHRNVNTLKKMMENHHPKLTSLLSRQLQNRRHRISMLEQHAGDINPFYLLKKGYSITTKDDKRIYNGNSLKVGDKIKTRYYEGETVSIVKKR